MYGSNKVAEAMEQFLAPRTRWGMMVVAVCVAYFVARLIPWAAAGFPVVG